MSDGAPKKPTPKIPEGWFQQEAVKTLGKVTTDGKDPPGWANTRRVVIERAQGQCQHQDEKPHATIAGQTVKLRCGFPGRDVDHILNLADGGTDDLSNLQLLCEWHHKRKTQAEAKAKRVKRTERHPGERHPGIIG